MGLCEKCGKLTGVLLLIFGVLFLLKDLNVWNFWNIGAWTVVFIMSGLIFLGKSGCPMCLKNK